MAHVAATRETAVTGLDQAGIPAAEADPEVQEASEGAAAVQVTDAVVATVPTVHTGSPADPVAVDPADAVHHQATPAEEQLATEEEGTRTAHPPQATSEATHPINRNPPSKPRPTTHPVHGCAAGQGQGAGVTATARRRRWITPAWEWE